MNQMVERAKSIADVIDVPLIADADDGYGARTPMPARTLSSCKRCHRPR
jgi:2-methylisocitrate lyase-like PEP mutase family enzyme